MDQIGCERKKLSGLRQFFCPIYSDEVKRVLPLALIMFLMCFCYGILRSVKDSVVIPVQGAQIIPFIQLWVILPMAFAMTFLFTKLSNRLNQEKVFYIIVMGFILFFLFFAFVLYPYGDQLYLTKHVASIKEKLPSGWSSFVTIIEYWPCTLFYAIAELWHSFVMSVLFWGFANEITSIKESARFYAVFGTAFNLGAMASGQVANFFAQGAYLNPYLPYGSNSWEQSVMTLALVVSLAGGITLFLFRWMHTKVLMNARFDLAHLSLAHKKKSHKTEKPLLLSQCLQILAKNSYLRSIAVIVIAYNLLINLTEVVWKHHVAALHTNQESFNHFMNNLTSSVGFVSILMTFFLPCLLKRFGWTKSSLITPIMMVVTGLFFFVFLLFEEALAPFMFATFGISPLICVVFIGALQNALSKAMRYSVLETTKEMAFIPLSNEDKLRGKASIDGVGSRFGKSGGAVIYQGLLLVMGSIVTATPVVAVIFLMMSGLWIASTVHLGQQLNEMTEGALEQDVNLFSSTPGLNPKPLS